MTTETCNVCHNPLAEHRDGLACCEDCSATDEIRWLREDRHSPRYVWCACNGGMEWDAVSEDEWNTRATVTPPPVMNYIVVHNDRHEDPKYFGLFDDLASAMKAGEKRAKELAGNRDGYPIRHMYDGLPFWLCSCEGDYVSVCKLEPSE